MFLKLARENNDRDLLCKRIQGQVHRSDLMASLASTPGFIIPNNLVLEDPDRGAIHWRRGIQNTIALATSYSGFREND